MKKYNEILPFSSFFLYIVFSHQCCRSTHFDKRVWKKRQEEEHVIQKGYSEEPRNSMWLDRWLNLWFAFSFFFLPRLSYWPSEQRLLLKSKLTLIQRDTKWEEKPSFDSICITDHFNLFAFCDINYCFLRYFHWFCDILFALRLLPL